MKPAACPLAVLATILLHLAAACRAGEPDEKIGLTEEGKKLAGVLDALAVEEHWKAGEHITDWKAGTPDGKTGGPATLTGIGEPVQLRGARVSSRFFDIYGIPAALGQRLISGVNTARACS